jgi:hypothetical protein
MLILRCCHCSYAVGCLCLCVPDVVLPPQLVVHDDSWVFDAGFCLDGDVVELYLLILVAVLHFPVSFCPPGEVDQLVFAFIKLGGMLSSPLLGLLL